MIVSEVELAVLAFRKVIGLRFGPCRDLPHFRPPAGSHFCRYLPGDPRLLYLVEAFANIGDELGTVKSTMTSITAITNSQNTILPFGMDGSSLRKTLRSSPSGTLIEHLPMCTGLRVRLRRGMVHP